MIYLGYAPLSVPSSPFDDTTFEDISTVSYNSSALEAKVIVGISAAGSSADETINDISKKRIDYYPLPISYPTDVLDAKLGSKYCSDLIEIKERINEIKKTYLPVNDLLLCIL